MKLSVWSVVGCVLFAAVGLLVAAGRVGVPDEGFAGPIPRTLIYASGLESLQPAATPSASASPQVTSTLQAAGFVYLPLVLANPSPAAGGQTPTATPSASASPQVTGTVAAGSSAPRLFFTDLESGPNSGGQDNLGPFITIWGEGFGAARGSSTVTIGGREVAKYVQWGEDNGVARKLDMIVVQPGPAVASGDLVVTVGGKASNPLPFTVRPGNIYFVATNGDDAGPGSLAQPWRTIGKAKDTIAAGDIAYIRDGVTETAQDNFSAALSIETSGASGASKALVAYPGATVTVGSTGTEFGLRVPNTGAVANDWLIAKLVLRGQLQAVDIGGGGARRWRVVGNDISCPVGDGQSGCFAASLAGNIAFLGNAVHGISKQGTQPSKQYHAVYFTTDTNHVEVGWNHIYDNNTCRAIQFHSSPLNATTGYNQYDLSVHDNLIHGDVCDGIVFATVDPSKGPVRAFNNVIYDVGRGPSPPDGDANYAGIYVAGGTNTGADGTGTVEIFNNTVYDVGARKNLPNPVGDEGAFSRGPGSPGLLMSLKNNVVNVVAGEDYISPNSATALITGSNNLWFGGGSAPAFLAGNVSADPQFASIAARDFRLQAQSPAIDAGTNTGLGRDYAGVARPQGSAHDIGAYEFVGQSSTPAATATPTLTATSAAGASATPTLTATSTGGQTPTATATSTPTATPTSGPPSTATATVNPAITPFPPGAVSFFALGDSLTEGDGDDFGRGGYPARLLTMVQVVRPGSTATNLGHSGWASIDLINGMDDRPSPLTLTVAARPTFATVLIGSNDLWYLYGNEGVTSNTEEAADLANYTANIDTILRTLRDAGVRVFIGLVDDQSLRPVAANDALRNATFTGITREELPRMSQQAISYNSVIQAKAAQYGAITVDFYHTTIFTNTATLNEDGNHPNAAGYDAMTQIWFAAISPLLN